VLCYLTKQLRIEQNRGEHPAAFYGGIIIVIFIRMFYHQKILLSHQAIIQRFYAKPSKSDFLGDSQN